MDKNCFSQRISKIDGNRKFRRLNVVLKLELKLKLVDVRQTDNYLPIWGALSWAIYFLVVFQTAFLYFKSLFKLPESGGIPEGCLDVA